MFETTDCSTVAKQSLGACGSNRTPVQDAWEKSSPTSMVLDASDNQSLSATSASHDIPPLSSASSEDDETILASAMIGQQLGVTMASQEKDPEKQDMDMFRNMSSISSSSIISNSAGVTITLPEKRLPQLLRRLRHNILAVYQRLFTLTLVANLIAWVTVLAQGFKNGGSGPLHGNLAIAVAANFTVAILIRQEFTINALYTVCCWTPHSWPMAIRRRIAKLYEFGGVHSGSAVSSLIWFVTFSAFITRDYANGHFNEPAVIVITYILLALLLSICIFAVPSFRFMSHNTFEAVHRFAGWISVALFWADLLLVIHAQTKIPGTENLGRLVLKSPACWLLVAITFSIILPWLRLRKVAAIPEVLSNHATRIHFDYTKVGTVMGIRLALHPLKEWHPFATIPAPDGKSFSMLVSNAGDWTKEQIQTPRNQYWVRGIPLSGVLRMAMIFRRVVVVATGSGIGPCLSMFIAHPMPCRLLWSTPSPLQTYGATIMDAVHQADPEAEIIDTRVSGRPDMLALAYHMFVKSQAEAVFVISNPKLTKKVVYGMESRGVPAYGPIWDS